MERPAEGDQIVVLYYTGDSSRGVLKTFVCGFENWSGHTHVAYTRPEAPAGLTRLSNEGITWARGHSGPEVDALLAAEALR